MEDLAEMLMLMTLFISIAAVILLRPLAKNLGEYLKVLAEQKSLRKGDDVAQLERTVATLEQRLSLLEERQRFSEALLDSRHSVGAQRLEIPAGTERARSNALESGENVG